MSTEGSRNKGKGDLAEDLVALLHEVPGVTVKVRTKLPVLTSRIGATREIDVLLEGQFAGFPFRVVFEVKNESSKTSTDQIDAFHQRLMDVGVHAGTGIFVSSAGYTDPAREKAKQLGIRTYLLKGLSDDRLSIAVNNAMQSLIYLVATWRDINIFPSLPGSPDPGEQFIKSDIPQGSPNGISIILNLIWRLWVRGHIPPLVGEHLVHIRAPDGWSASSSRSQPAGEIIVTVDVTAHVATLRGSVSQVALANAEDDDAEKISRRYNFPAEGGIELETLTSDAALESYIQSNSKEDILVTTIRVPRIVHETCFWPPTKEALARIANMLDKGELPSFDQVEGSNLYRAWVASSGK